MFIDRIIDTILRPFREITRIFSSVNSTKAGIQMDVQRIRMTPQMVGNEMRMAAHPLVQTGREVQTWGSQPNQQAQQQAQQQQQQQQQQAMAVAPAPGKKKMSFWPWSKKTCIRCSQKLHKSWDQCPYCGQNQSAPVAGPPPMQAGPQPGQPPAQGYPGQAPYGMQGQPPPYGMQAPMPTPGMAMKTIAMDAAAINAPLMATGDTGDNVAWLVPLDGPLTGELLQVKGRATIGSGDQADIRVMDGSISGRHCEVTVGQGNRFRITDLGSRNGTYVNDKTIASVELVDGDNIRLGRTTFRFKTKS